MEKFPNINTGRYVLLCLDRNTGTVLDLDFNNYTNNSEKKAYAVLNSIADAKEYAEQKIANIKTDKNVGYYIYDSKENVVFHTDNL